MIGAALLLKAGLRQRDHGNLRWAAEPQRQAGGSDSSIDIELGAIGEDETALQILFPQLRQVHRLEEGKADLAAMRMSGKDQRDPPVDRAIGEIGFMSQQDERFPIRIPAAGKRQR